MFDRLQVVSNVRRQLDRLEPAPAPGRESPSPASRADRRAGLPLGVEQGEQAAAAPAHAHRPTERSFEPAAQLAQLRPRAKRPAAPSRSPDGAAATSRRAPPTATSPAPAPRPPAAPGPSRRIAGRPPASASSRPAGRAPPTAGGGRGTGRTISPRPAQALLGPARKNGTSLPNRAANAERSSAARAYPVPRNAGPEALQGQDHAGGVGAAAAQARADRDALDQPRRPHWPTGGPGDPPSRRDADDEVPLVAGQARPARTPGPARTAAAPASFPVSPGGAVRRPGGSAPAGSSACRRPHRPRVRAARIRLRALPRGPGKPPASACQRARRYTSTTAAGGTRLPGGGRRAGAG